MKKATIVGLSIAAVAGLAGMASAAPLGVSELVDRGGLGVSEIGQGGGGGSSVSQNAQSIGPNVTQTAVNGALSSLNTQVQSVPEAGSTLLLLGTGLLALAAWHRWSRGGMAA